MDGARDCPQPKEMNPIVRDAVREKLEKFRTKGYVRQGTVKGLTSYFTVPKGDAMSGSALMGPNPVPHLWPSIFQLFISCSRAGYMDGRH